MSTKRAFRGTLVFFFVKTEAAAVQVSGVAETADRSGRHLWPCSSWACLWRHGTNGARCRWSFGFGLWSSLLEGCTKDVFEKMTTWVISYSISMYNNYYPKTPGMEWSCPLNEVAVYSQTQVYLWFPRCTFSHAARLSKVVSNYFCMICFSLSFFFVHVAQLSLLVFSACKSFLRSFGDVYRDRNDTIPSYFRISLKGDGPPILPCPGDLAGFSCSHLFDLHVFITKVGFI